MKLRADDQAAQSRKRSSFSPAKSYQTEMAPLFIHLFISSCMQSMLHICSGPKKLKVLSYSNQTDGKQ